MTMDQLPESVAIEFNNIFTEIDKDQNGEITVAEVKAHEHKKESTLSPEEIAYQEWL